MYHDSIEGHPYPRCYPCPWGQEAAGAWAERSREIMRCACCPRAAAGSREFPACSGTVLYSFTKLCHPYFFYFVSKYIDKIESVDSDIFLFINYPPVTSVLVCNWGKVYTVNRGKIASVTRES